MPLYISATPIGNLKDITVRTLESLQNADLILCEDTRVTQTLLKHYNIQKPLKVYNDFKTPHRSIIEKLTQNKNVVLVSDAGTPLISDPGYKLIQLCYEHHIKVIVEPGPSAILNALILSGLPPYPFYFGGFFDIKKSDLSAHATLIFFEAPHRLLKTLKALRGIPRTIVVTRELTKVYEEIRTGNADTLIEHFTQHPPKGEIALLLSPIEEKVLELSDAVIQKALEQYSLNEASKRLSHLYGVPKKDIYKRAILLK